jgi:hypothetical protein
MRLGRGERGGAKARTAVGLWGGAKGQPEQRAAADGAEREGQRRSNSSCRWGGARRAAPNKEQLPMGRGKRAAPNKEQLPMGPSERGSAEGIAAADGAGREGKRRTKSSCRWGGARGAARRRILWPQFVACGRVSRDNCFVCIQNSTQCLFCFVLQSTPVATIVATGVHENDRLQSVYRESVQQI